MKTRLGLCKFVYMRDKLMKPNELNGAANRLKGMATTKYLRNHTCIVVPRGQISHPSGEITIMEVANSSDININFVHNVEIELHGRTKQLM